ncbi:hypothetical protein THRCLA_08358 [Thraustotheca clavata]|uniref:DUF895 domain membrane protein n=1 Tax=Thraustotheca clavata TaxID=74557 RepID=A0A1V9Z754_9STRA|nr:hypothetical protein THRCLA_08358 [Thraustotheca clavata]
MADKNDSTYKPVATPVDDYQLEEGAKVAGKPNSFMQIVILGFVCFGCPGMFNAINGLGGGGQVDSTVSSNSNVALYATFAFFSVFSGSIHNYLGPRLTLFIGGLPYVLYIGSFLNYNHTLNGTFVIVAGGILGVGAALLWTAQGAMVLSYPTENEKGKFISTCWIIFNLGGVLGALVPFILNYNSEAGAVNDGTYIAFLIIMVCGAALALFMKNPSSIIRSDNTQVLYPKSASVKEEVLGLYHALFDWRMLCLIPASFASNFFYQYQFNGVNGYLFTLRSRSLNGTLYWGMQMLAAFVFGNYVMDKESLSRQLRGKLGLGIVTFFTFLAWILGVILQKDYDRDNKHYDRIDFTDSSRAAFPMIVFLLYGLVDAVYQNYVYWVIGAMSNDPLELARFVGLYKAFQSAGGAISWKVDVWGVDYMTQLVVDWVLMAVSFPFMYLVIRKLPNIST